MLHSLQRFKDIVQPTKARVLACALILVGSPTYYLCRNHVCIGGHMEHPPYPLTAYLGDALWLACFVIAFGLAALSNLRWRYLPCIFIAFLFFTRFWLMRLTFTAGASLPTELFYTELPVQAALCFYAILGLLGFRMRKNHVRRL